MKTRIHNHGSKKQSFVIATAVMASGALVVVGSLAVAEPLNPSGSHTEARLEKLAPAPADRTVTQEVKHWVKSKISAFWGEGESKHVVAARPATVTAKNEAAPAAASAQVQPAVRGPSAMPAQALRAPAAASIEERGPLDVPGVQRTKTGVASYDVATSPAIPKLNLAKEPAIPAAHYALDSGMQKVLDSRVIRALESPELMIPERLHELKTLQVARAGEVTNVKQVFFQPKGPISRAAFDKIVLNLKPELGMKLAKVQPLTPDELRFLSGLYLYQQGDQCPTAIGLFHKLSKADGWEAEANYYLAMCSKKLSLKTDFYERTSRVLDTGDVYYSRKILSEVDSDVPYEVADRFGNSLLKASGNPKTMDGLAPVVMANIAYDLADFGVSSERFKTALSWAKQVPATHSKYLKAQFLLALAEYQAGSKETALKIQDEIVADTKIDKTKLEFQALVALNAARMHFQERNFKQAHENFHKVYKDHPLWLQSLTELGWAQLMDGDFEGAVGNMYSIQSPFFTAVYKPESYVIRTIGYLNLCQYGDAYKALSILEHDYRPYLDSMEGYIKRSESKPAYYQTVRSFFTAAKGTKEIDQLPMPIVREMARHRDFTNLQKALNRQVDERPNYAAMDNEVENRLKAAQNVVNNTRKEIDGLRKKLTLIEKRKNQKNARAEALAHIDTVMNRLNDNFFFVDMYNEAKVGMDEYRKEIIGGADKRIADMRGQIEHVLANRLLRMKVDLARMLDNNELLRYEVFSGSGENIRFQVAGGEVGKRIAANILPKSKSLQWDFDGEYWEDEIGHYRSSLKNNCPDHQERAQASLDGGTK